MTTSEGWAEEASSGGGHESFLERINLGPAGPAGVAVAELGGCRLLTDPAEPHRMVAVEDIHVPGSLGVVLALLGDEGYDAIRSGRGIGGSAGRGPDANNACRVALIRWVSLWSPMPVNRQLFAVEEAVLLARLEHLGVSEEAEDAVDSVADWCIAVLEGAAAGLDGRLLSIVTEALQAGSRLLAGSRREACATWARQATTATSDRDATSEPENLDELLAGPINRGPTRGPTRGGHPNDLSSEPVTREFSVDWVQVPWGVLDPAERTVAATWNGPSAPVNVTVLAAADPRLVDDLEFRLLNEDQPYRPLAQGPLIHDAASRTYRGMAFLPPGVAFDDRTTVDVYSLSSQHPPRIGAAGRRAAAQRQGVWALTLERLSRVTEDPDLADAAQHQWFTTAYAYRAQLNALPETDPPADRDTTRSAMSEELSQLVAACRAHAERSTSGDADKEHSDVTEVRAPFLFELALLGALTIPQVT